MAEETTSTTEKAVVEKSTDQEKSSEKKADTSGEKDLSKTAKQVLETVEKMTVLELSELVKVLEDKFGVVAAAPAAVAAAGADADEDSEPATVSVILTECGDKKIQVLKAIREITSLGLKEAKEMVDTVPKAVKEGIEKAEAEEIKKKLEAQGGKVEIK
ncbi:MAG: 50S ribosomal protein L7/L12 [Candidatus Margulisbacteria bacterium]|nr:50S ribosomal protein L7/L12 [Candidatus Margulisiibacteriota bacterium]